MLAEKVILITGGAGLIGQEFARAVIKNNGIAIIADIDELLGTQTTQRLTCELGTTDIEFVHIDINSKSSIANAIKHLDSRYGRIDALVNNAYPRNKNYGRHFFDVEYADFCENLSRNLGGYFLCSQLLAIYYKMQGYGNIVNIASVYGEIAPRFDLYNNTDMTMPVEYAAIKSAVIHITKYMAKYFKGLNIRVNALSPGGILNAQPRAFLDAYRYNCLNKGMLEAADLVGTLVYLLSDMSTNLNGQNIVVDDGFTL